MPTEVTITGYLFTELAADIQQQVLERECRLHYENLPCEWVTEEIQDYVRTELGTPPNPNGHSDIDDLKVAYSLGYCQGDGVALYGTLYRFQAPLLAWPDGLDSIKLERNSLATHYSHENTFTTEGYDEDGNYTYGVVDIAGITLDLRALCRRAAAYGYKWIENATSPEAVKDYLVQDDCLFTVNGKIISLQYDYERVSV